MLFQRRELNPKFARSRDHQQPRTQIVTIYAIISAGTTPPYKPQPFCRTYRTTSQTAAHYHITCFILPPLKEVAVRIIHMTCEKFLCRQCPPASTQTVWFLVKRTPCPGFSATCLEELGLSEGSRLPVSALIKHLWQHRKELYHAPWILYCFS